MADGVILWEGESELTGDPIAVIATGLKKSSTNRKTGGMVQVYIIRTDVAPHVAVKTGQDEAICGDCPHRAGSCYVLTFQGPLAVYKTYKAGKYPHAETPFILRGYDVRFGTYGDPAAVPFEVWERYIESMHKRWTGYTHQWRNCDPRLSLFFMASADCPTDHRDATGQGWRTFRVRAASDSLLPGEIVCPASDEAGHKTTCGDCGLCNGSHPGDQRANIVIVAHGPAMKTKAYRELRAKNPRLRVVN